MNTIFKIQQHSILINSTLRKCIHASSIQQSIAITMNKILKGTAPRKKRWSNNEHSPIPYNSESIAKGANEGIRSVNSKRVTVLNKLFMRHITDLMATGTCSSAFLGRGIEINRVQVTPDFKGVNVFWLASGTENDQEVEDVLKTNAGHLRHELSQLRVMGIVPKIHFVKDKQYAKLMEVDLRLTKADFGEDYVPVDLNKILKTHPILTTALEPQIKEEIQRLELNNEDDPEEIVPEMPMNVLGLNHNDIMERVKRGIKRSQVPHRVNNTSENVETSYPQTTNSELVQFSCQKEQNAVFKEFLLKRKIMKAKANKPVKNELPEADYLEYERKKFIDNLSFGLEYEEAKDYLDDEVER